MKAQSNVLFRRIIKLVLMGAAILVVQPLSAQTSTAGPGIDLELINPTDGSNVICVAPNTSFSVRLWVHPGTGSTTCTPACGSAVAGGNGHIATAVIDVEFDSNAITYVGAANNTTGAGVDGLIQDNHTSGRIGWALAGDWTPDADTSGSLANPCDMTLLESAGWVAQFNFTAGSSQSASRLHFRRQNDDSPFALSLADICGSDAFTRTNGGIDEVIDARIYVSNTCPCEIFFDDFELGNTSHWTTSQN